MLRSRVKRSIVVLVALLLGAAPCGARAQHVRYSVLLGAGHTAWTGPYTRGGTLGLALGAGALEWRVAKPLAVRAELGGGRYAADLGNTGSFSEPTTLSFYRLHLAALGRVYAPMRAGRPLLFVELGAAAWYRTGCDVDTVGGPGFLGGETVDCDEWESEVSSDAHPLRPNPSGSALLLGIGGYLGRLGLTLRYETAGRAVIETPEGPMHARALVLAAEWVFNGPRWASHHLPSASVDRSSNRTLTLP